MKRKLPVVDAPGWGLVRIPGSAVRGKSYRRPDCASLRAHEEVFIRAYGTAQGRCPEDCGGYRAEPPTAAIVQFAAHLGVTLNLER